MGKLVYRMCLFVILIIAVAGGVYYYKTIYQKEEDMDKGTFVENTDRALQRAEKKAVEPALGGMQNKMAEMVQDTLHDAEYAEHTAGSMLRQAGETGKEVVRQAAHAGKKMFAEAGYAGKDLLTEAEKAGKKMLTEAGYASKHILTEAENAGENMRNVLRQRV